MTMWLIPQVANPTPGPGSLPVPALKPKVSGPKILQMWPCQMWPEEQQGRQQAQQSPFREIINFVASLFYGWETEAWRCDKACPGRHGEGRPGAHTLRPPLSCGAFTVGQEGPEGAGLSSLGAEIPEGRRSAVIWMQVRS